MKNSSSDWPFLTTLKPRSSSKPTTPTPTATPVSSSFDRSVCLYNWWLEKPPNGKGLAVGGFASLERVGVRAFGSAEISKRHDATTLETTDGINITISGFINRSRTRQNGYPSEVCNRFQLGFPCNWEEYADGCSGEKSADESVPTRVSASDDSNRSLGDGATSPFSILDLPATRIHDLLSTFGDREHRLLRKSIYNDVLGKSMGNDQTNNEESGLNESPVYQKESNSDSKCNVSKTSPDSRDMATEECEKAGYESKMGMDVLNPTLGRSTRSMSRLKNLKMEQGERLPPNSNFEHRSSDWTISSDATRERLRGNVRRNAVKVSHPTNFVEEDEDEDEDDKDDEDDEDYEEDENFCLSSKKPVIRKSRTRKRLRGIVRRK